MTAVYNGAGAYLRNIPLISSAGAAPLAADTDQFFVAIEPIAGTWVAVSIANQPDVARNVTFGVVDANSSITAGYLEIIGFDSQGRALQETITFPGGGTATVVGLYAFGSITSARYMAAGVVTGAADTFQGGYGDVLGLPYAIADIADVKNRRKDSSAGVGTILIPGGTHGTWTLSGGDVPNAARQFFCDIQSTA